MTGLYPVRQEMFSLYGRGHFGESNHYPVYYRFQDRDPVLSSSFNGGRDDNGMVSSDIFSVGGGYRFGDWVSVHAMAAWDANEDTGHGDSGTAWQVGTVFGSYDLQRPGSISGHIAYRYLGNSVVRGSDYGMPGFGQKGWDVGATYVPIKNLSYSVWYFTGKGLEGKQETKTIFSEICYSF